MKLICFIFLQSNYNFIVYNSAILNFQIMNSFEFTYINKFSKILIPHFG